MSGARDRPARHPVRTRGPRAVEAVRRLATATQALDPRARASRIPPIPEGPLNGIAATVAFHGVKVIAESERALCCRISGRDHWIPPGRFLKGTSVEHFGDRGTVVVTSEFAEIQGLRVNAFPAL
jgi:hypothetical protein